MSYRLFASVLCAGLFVTAAILLSPAFVLAAEAEAADAEAGATGSSDTDLAKKAQNPVADLISVPIQTNINFSTGAKDKTQTITLVQPVIPMPLTDEWNVIIRPILPLVNQPETPRQGRTFGLGDLNLQMYFTPARPSKVIVGFGPSLIFPTATDDVLGAEQWSAGPGIVILTMDGPWVYGGLVSQVWSYAGDDDRADVSMMTVQPFLNYNLPDGWYLTTSPVVTANWEASTSQTWTVPVGGGAGRIFHIGKQAMNTQVQAFYNVEKPDAGAEWTLRLQVQFLFPK